MLGVLVYLSNRLNIDQSKLYRADRNESAISAICCFVEGSCIISCIALTYFLKLGSLAQCFDLLSILVTGGDLVVRICTPKNQLHLSQVSPPSSAVSTPSSRQSSAFKAGIALNNPHLNLASPGGRTNRCTSATCFFFAPYTVLYAPQH